MSEVNVKASLDKAVSETKEYSRYVFRRGTGIEGAVYISKEVPFPDKVIIELKKGDDDNAVC